MSPRTQIVHALVVLLSVVSSGCKILQPKEDPTRHFFLKAPPQSKLTTDSQLRVLIGPVDVPGYLESSEIVTVGNQNELQLADYHVWAESLEDGIGRVLSENISRLLDSPAVVPFPNVDTVSYDFRVPVIVRRFEKADDGKVHLAVSYAVAGSQLASAADGETASRSITADVAAPGSFGAIADAMSRALGDLSKAIASDVLAADRKRKAKEKAAEQAAAAAEQQPD